MDENIGMWRSCSKCTSVEGGFEIINTCGCECYQKNAILNSVTFQAYTSVYKTWPYRQVSFITNNVSFHHTCTREITAWSLFYGVYKINLGEVIHWYSTPNLTNTSARNSTMFTFEFEVCHSHKKHPTVSSLWNCCVVLYACDDLLQFGWDAGEARSERICQLPSAVHSKARWLFLFSCTARCI